MTEILFVTIKNLLLTILSHGFFIYKFLLKGSVLILMCRQNLCNYNCQKVYKTSMFYCQKICKTSMFYCQSSGDKIISMFQGAKLFYLSGMVNGEYQKMEVHNLCRFISVMKFRPLVWRTTHPYILADRCCKRLFFAGT